VRTTREVSRTDPSFPRALLTCPSPPRRIWLRGDERVLDHPCVAIVGTRTATSYGERIAHDLARALAVAGACVVSGLARGIDAAAHRGALDAGGATVAVLGTGVDVSYPRGHARLQGEIAERGLLVSELPPADPAHGGSFPRRNRIIAALSAVTVVVEAGVKSGALITAAHALELGRSVAAVPGPIDVPQAQGSNELLRDGAIPITSIADVVTLLGLDTPVRRVDIPVEGSERLLWDALGKGAADLDTLCARMALPVHEGMAAVSALEMRGLIECGLPGEIRRV
jgi:DNA processing protein